MSVADRLWSIDGQHVGFRGQEIDKVSQNGSLKRRWSPIFGLKLGKSNMIAPLLQSAPSEVLVVTCPRRSKCGLPNLMLMLRAKASG